MKATAGQIESKLNKAAEKREAKLEQIKQAAQASYSKASPKKGDMKMSD